MEMNIGSRLKHAWNAFLNRDPPGSRYYGGGYSYRPDRMRFSRGSERTIINAIYNRIALDAASITINHVKLDENNRFDSIIDSGLNYCLNTEANADQTGRGLIQDIVMTFLEEGVAAVVPEKTNFDPRYPKGVAWNGITAIKESPDGADATDLWADNIKYGSIRAGEKYNFTPEAYFYPPEFGECDGSAEVAPGVTISQQKRKPFGLTWQTLIGSDEDDELGFTLHLVWGATASPSERSHESYNDSPDAEIFSWDCDTTPVKVTGYKPTAHMELDSTKVPQAKMEKLLNILYGTANTTPYLPLPDEVIKLMTT